MSEQINTKDIQPTDFLTRYKELGFNKVGSPQLLKDVSWDGNGTQFQSRNNQAFYNSKTGEVVIFRNPPMNERSQVNQPEFVWSTDHGFRNDRLKEQFTEDQILKTYQTSVDLAYKQNFENVEPKLFERGEEVGIAQDEASNYIAEQFTTTDADRYFVDQGGAGQYPIDAIYNKTGQSQDHLVISQYRYKSPRAGDVWGKNRRLTGTLLTQGIKRGSALEQFLGLVRLPMPNTIQDSNNVRWGEDTMNAIEAAMIRAVGSPKDEVIGGGAAGLLSMILGGGFKEGAISSIGTAKFADLVTSVMGNEENKQAAGNILTPEIVARILSSQGIETSAESILARRDGVIPNSNLELLFSAPMLRQFSFMYKMSPRSRAEASIVNQILRFFKQGMSAKKQTAKSSATEGRSYFLGTPNVFRLQYRTTEGEPIKGINRIKTCALTQASVNYTPEGTFASYDKGQPVSVMLTLGFQELEPIYDSDYKFTGGTADTRGYDEDTGLENRLAIEKDEVGY